MPKSNGDGPTQHTPKGEEIPVPTREEVLRDLGKVAKPRKPISPARDRERGPEDQEGE